MKTIKKVKMETLKTAILFCIAVALAGCDLPVMRNYDVDTSPDGVRFRTVLEHFENNYNKDLTMYCRAIRHAGLQETIESGGMTLVAPVNLAFNDLLAQFEVESIEEINPVVLRSLLLYLIFPGDYRAVTMTPDEDYRCVSLAGDPIHIKRAPTTSNKYRVVINDTNELASGLVTVSQQDYVFKDQVVVQVVGTFITYMPPVLATQRRPDSFVLPEDVSTATLTVTDDCSVYQGNTIQSYNGATMQVTGRTGQFRYGFFKFPLDDIDFKDDISSATLVTRIYNVITYSIGEQCTVEFREFHFSDWQEASASWDIMRGPYDSPIERAPIVIERTNFTVFSTSGEDWLLYPDNLRTDVSASISNYYMRDSTHFSVLVADISANVAAAGTQIQFCTRNAAVTNNRFYSHIELMGAFPSEMVLMRNNPVVVTDGVATLDPEIHFSMGNRTGAAYPISDRNTIFVMKTPPANGFLTIYGIPAKVNSRFTQAQMRAGVVKYLRTTNTSDSFELKALDYLGGMYYEGDDPGITVHVN